MSRGQIAFCLSLVIWTAMGAQNNGCKLPGTGELVGFVPAIGSAQDVVVDGGEAFVASQEFSLAVADVNTSSSSYLDVIGASNEPGLGKSTAVSGNRAVVLGETPEGKVRIAVLDIGLADAPRVLGELTTNTAASLAWKVALNGTGSRAVAAMGSLGIWVIDLGNPAAPRLVGSYNTPGVASDVALNSTGSIAYVADGTGDLQILSLSNPSNPTRLSSLSLSGVMRSVDVKGSLVYLLSQNGGFQIVDASSPSAPRLVGLAGTAFGLDIAVEGNRAAIVTSPGSGQYLLEIFDIANASSPRDLGSVSLPGTGRAVDLVGGRAYVATDAAGVTVYETGGAPAAVQTLSTVGVAQDIAVDGARGVVADVPGTLSIFDL